jgi:hypothetical protein
MSLRKMFDTMLGRKSTVVEIKKDDPKNDSKKVSDVDDTFIVCPPAKYQVLTVNKNTSIKDFVIENGLAFKPGKGFYEFTKPEIINPKKSVVLMKKDTHELYEGNRARKLIGLTSEKKRFRPTDVDEYRVFIQSTSYNRKLLKNTGFLYEAEDWGY